MVNWGVSFDKGVIFKGKYDLMNEGDEEREDEEVDGEVVKTRVRKRVEGFCREGKRGFEVGDDGGDEMVEAVQDQG